MYAIRSYYEKFPEAVKLISENGHDLANHSYSHFRMNSLGLDKIKDEIIRCDEVLQKYTDKKIELFRPPYGEYNNNVVSVAEQNGVITSYSIHYTKLYDAAEPYFRSQLAKRAGQN